MKYSNMRKAAININTFIKTFVDRSLSDIVERANALATADKLTIVNAQLSFIGSGTISEQMVLTVVYERDKPKRTKKTNNVKEDDIDE